MNTLIDWDVKLGFLEKVGIFLLFTTKKDGFGLKIYINKCKQVTVELWITLATFYLEIMLESTKTKFV